MKQQIYKNIIFDLGGVIVNLNPMDTMAAFAMLGNITTEQVLAIFHSSPVFTDYETGKISDAEFRSGIRTLLRTTVSDEAIDTAWNAMIQDTPSERTAMMKALQAHYKVCIFSNTNNIHISLVHDQLEGLQNFEPVAHHVYYSHEIGERKPNQDAFIKVLGYEGLQAEETVFLDDNIDNVNAANAVGIKGILVSHPDEVPQLLKNEGIEF